MESQALVGAGVRGTLSGFFVTLSHKASSGAWGVGVASRAPDVVAQD